MKRILFVVAAGLFLSLFIPHGALAFGVKDILGMSQDGIPDSLIIEKIRHSDTRFDLGARDFHALREAGVSNDVVVAMLRTEDSGHPAAYRDGYYWPYYSPWYLGLDFDFYAPHYRTVYGGPRFGYRGYRRPGYGVHHR
jgi:hypothetical protein